ncbi:hypothetical protein D3C76_1689170 [compost metagenome]
MKGQAFTYIWCYYNKLHLKEGETMKSYKSSDSIHIVGRAWQVRIMLQQWQDQWGPYMTIKEMLNKINP